MFAELLDQCERWYRAWFEKDAATVERLMAEDYLYVGPSGLVMDREAILAVIRSPSYRLDEGTRSEVVVRGVGQEAAIVRHRWQGAGSYEGASFTDDSRCVMVWEKREGEWRLVMDQCSFSSEARAVRGEFGPTAARAPSRPWRALQLPAASPS
jgi:uncharacterized protein (TIGR02246 family)